MTMISTNPQIETPGAEGPNDAELAAKYDAAQGGANGTESTQESLNSGQTEELIGGKFKSQEDLLSAYNALQQKMGKGETETSEAPAEKPEANEEASDLTIEKPEQTPELSFDKFTEEFSTNGGLSDDSYAELTKMGLPRDIVDSYIAGQTVLAEQQANEVFDAVGGKESFSNMTKWAGTNWSDAQVDAFNAAMESGNKESSLLAVNGLKAAYQASNGSEPNLVSGGRTADVGDSYASMSEVMADMGKPEYAQSPTFRAQVEQKLARSNVI